MNLSEFEKQFKTLYLPLCMYALRHIDDRDAAEDIVQEAFMKTWQKIEAGTSVADFKPYIYRSVRNECVSWLRANASSHLEVIDNLEDLEDPSIEAPSLEDSILTAERDARLWRAIDALPSRCREIFLLSKQDGLSNEEIATRLRLSLQTVKNQMSKAYSRLRDSITYSGSHPVFFLPFL